MTIGQQAVDQIAANKTGGSGNKCSQSSLP